MGIQKRMIQDPELFFRFWFYFLFLGGSDPAQWEDITASNPLNFLDNCASFTSSVSARSVLNYACALLNLPFSINIFLACLPPSSFLFFIGFKTATMISLKNIKRRATLMLWDKSDF